jgi:TPR repeat protein
LAAQGDVDAQLHLANAQAYGAQSPQDCQQASALYQQAIARGSPQEQARALFRLAYLYETGCGVEHNLDQARPNT